MTLKRFHDAQNGSSGYDDALLEMKDGRKTSHWIWYILPQIKELGFSPNAKFYGISDLEEACGYLRDPVLFKRYDELLQLVEQQLNQIPLETLMGGITDARKFTSSITLFRGIAAYLNATGQDKNQEFKKLEQRCDRIFKIISSQSYYPCETTLIMLENTTKENVTTKAVDTNAMSFFTENLKTNKTKPVFDSSLLIKELTEYQNTRNNEWGFHFNLLGIVSALYLLEDFFLGTDHFNSKSREVKLSAASKLKNMMDPTQVPIDPLTETEKKALQDGRLGDIVKKHGGLAQLLSNAENKQTKSNSSDTGLNR